MNNFFKVIILSVSTTFAIAPAFAQPHQPPAPQNHKAQPSNNMVKPSRDWKVGSKVPKQYQAKKFHVTDKADKRLSKPGKNQQWLKINGDYVLTKGTTYSIVKIIRG